MTWCRHLEKAARATSGRHWSFMWPCDGARAEDPDGSCGQRQHGRGAIAIATPRKRCENLGEQGDVAYIHDNLSVPNRERGRCAQHDVRPEVESGTAVFPKQLRNTWTLRHPPTTTTKNEHGQEHACKTWLMMTSNQAHVDLGLCDYARPAAQMCIGTTYPNVSAPSGDARDNTPVVARATGRSESVLPMGS